MSKVQYALKCGMTGTLPVKEKVVGAIKTICEAQNYTATPGQVSRFLKMDHGMVSRALNSLVAEGRIVAFGNGPSRVLKPAGTTYKIYREKIKRTSWKTPTKGIVVTVEEEKKDTKQIRKCLRCRKDFESEWKGNRLCPSCNSRSVY